MELRCREGELALIIREEPGCECNIGRIVTVHGPLEFSPGRGLTWLIEPVAPEPWAVFEYRDGSVWASPITLDNMIEHPDAWLQPIRSEIESDQLTQEAETQLLVEVGV